MGPEGSAGNFPVFSRDVPFRKFPVFFCAFYRDCQKHGLSLDRGITTHMPAKMQVEKAPSPRPQLFRKHGDTDKSDTDRTEISERYRSQFGALVLKDL